MGTPNFALPTLQAIIDDKDFEIVAVYSKEPQIAGRGHKIKNSPIHNLALQNNLKVITPKTLKNH
jgi:methionyl-tRNA formyltransferase